MLILGLKRYFNVEKYFSLCFIVFILGMLYIYVYLNRPFLSCQKSLFQSEAKCEAIDMKMNFHSRAINKKYFTLSFVLKARVLEFGKGPNFILINLSFSGARTHYPCQQPNTFHERIK